MANAKDQIEQELVARFTDTQQRQIEGALKRAAVIGATAERERTLSFLKSQVPNAAGPVTQFITAMSVEGVLGYED